MARLLSGFVLSIALIIPVVLVRTALHAEDQKSRSFHDKDHNDDHQWNSHEDKAYRMYEKQNHRKHADFAKLNESDQQAYWGWRHEHSDAVLKINIP